VTVRFTSRARGDLRDIALYTLDRWGSTQCDRYLNLLQERCQQVADMPELRRPSSDFPPYCRVLAGMHAVFYRPLNETSILVVRILHASMLPELHLPDSDEDIGDED
jgi:toxin ParE1/3/4